MWKIVDKRVPQTFNVINIFMSNLCSIFFLVVVVAKKGKDRNIRAWEWMRVLKLDIKGKKWILHKKSMRTKFVVFCLVGCLESFQ